MSKKSGIPDFWGQIPEKKVWATYEEFLYKMRSFLLKICKFSSFFFAHCLEGEEIFTPVFPNLGALEKRQIFSTPVLIHYLNDELLELIDVK